MRLSDLRDLRIVTLDGENLGRVHEVHCDNGRITAILCGAGSFIERLTARSGGHRIPWESVRRVDKKRIVVTRVTPKRAKKPSATRSRRGIRRPSALRSRR